MTTHATIRTPDRNAVHGLLEAEASRRQRQLDALAPADGDLVAEAHRSSVERIIADIRRAQERLAAGTYGECQDCRLAIPAERLRLRPWTPHCARCATR